MKAVWMEDTDVAEPPPAERQIAWLKKGSVIELHAMTLLEHVPSTSEKLFLVDRLEVSLPSDLAVFSGDTSTVLLNGTLTFQLATDARGFAAGEQFWLRKVWYAVPRYTPVKVVEAAAGSTWQGREMGPDVPEETTAAEEPEQPVPAAPAPPAATSSSSWTPWIVAAAVALAGIAGVTAWAATRKPGRRSTRGLGAATKPGCVLLTKSQALKLLDWHGGGGTSTYALGSSSFAGHCVDVSVAEDALFELQQFASDRYVRPKDLVGIEAMFEAIKHAIRKAGGAA